MDKGNQGAWQMAWCIHGPVGGSPLPFSDVVVGSGAVVQQQGACDVEMVAPLAGLQHACVHAGSLAGDAARVCINGGTLPLSL
jgi:hypothetical protein